MVLLFNAVLTYKTMDSRLRGNDVMGVSKLELFAPFATVVGWINLLTLIFLELVLGIDNLVFIAITTDRLPTNKKSIGRRFGLIAAFVMRTILLSLGFLIIHLTQTLFALPLAAPGMDFNFTAKDLLLLVGGGYLVYKGIAEILEKLSLREEKESINNPQDEHAGRIGLPQAIASIAVMDMIFSLDSVITALGMSGELMIMILAVMLAVIAMIVFVNPISMFINSNPEMKFLALSFIVVVGFKLIVESLNIELLIEGTEVSAIDIVLYFAMFFSIVITCIQMAYNHRIARLEKAMLSEPEPIEALDAAVHQQIPQTLPDKNPQV
jgi:predicted tellurium resistance membrane protein TerC